MGVEPQILSWDEPLVVEAPSHVGYRCLSKDLMYFPVASDDNHLPFVQWCDVVTDWHRRVCVVAEPDFDEARESWSWAPDLVHDPSIEGTWTARPVTLADALWVTTKYTFKDLDQFIDYCGDRLFIGVGPRPGESDLED
jgi:hypothetical protein